MSFEEFLSRRLAELLRFAVVLCGAPERAEQVVASVLVRAFPHWRAISGAGCQFAVLRTAVVRVFLDPDDGVRREPDESGQVSAIATGPGTLTDVDRATVVLAVYSSQTNEEIAAVLQRPQAMIAADLAHARAVLSTESGGADSMRLVDLLEAFADGVRVGTEAVISA